VQVLLKCPAVGARRAEDRSGIKDVGEFVDGQGSSTRARPRLCGSRTAPRLRLTARTPRPRSQSRADGSSTLMRRERSTSPLDVSPSPAGPRRCARSPTPPETRPQTCCAREGPDQAREFLPDGRMTESVPEPRYLAPRARQFSARAQTSHSIS
jgi:hypothetical protein